MASFTSTATLSYAGNVTTSNPFTGEVLSVLSATKTPVLSRYSVGDRITYIISIVNAVATAFTGLTVTDSLGSYTFGAFTLYPMTYAAGSAQYFVNGTLQAAPSVTAGPALQFTGISIPANGTALLIYEAQINSFAPLNVGSTLVNSATVTGGGLSLPVTATAAITVKNAPDLTITKSISPVPVRENDRLTYMFVIQNSGNTATSATDNVSVNDTLVPILTGLTVTFNGTAWDASHYSYHTTTGAFSTAPGQVWVPAAIYTQDLSTGRWILTPGVSTLQITGTV